MVEYNTSLKGTSIVNAD